MNNTFSISVMALLGAAALMAASCAKDFEYSQSGELIECTLQADMDWEGIDFGSKAALNADGVTPNWETGDKILVLGADKKPVGTDGIFTLSSGVGTTSGKFKGKIKFGQTPVYAIYPASAATVSGTSAVTAGTLTAPTGNDAGTIKGAVMLGESSDGKAVSFTNVCAVLTFNTGDYGKSGGDPAIKSVKVSASYGETATPIAGAFTIDWANLSIAPAGSGTVSELTVDLPSGLQANDKDVYIPIFPLPKNGSDVAPSMKYEFTDTRNNFTAEVSYDYFDAIEANTLKNLGAAYGLDFKPDARYWVDLGMVSDSGHKLYMSKYNVKKDNGKYVFDTDGIGDDFEWNEAATITDVNGESCRLPSDKEMANLILHSSSLSENPNISWSYNSSDNTCTLSSKLPAYMGNSVVFPDDNCFYYTSSRGRYFSLSCNGVDNGPGLVDPFSHHETTDKVRMVLEDEFSSYSLDETKKPFVEIDNVVYDNDNPIVPKKSGGATIRPFCLLDNGFTASNAKFESTNTFIAVGYTNGATYPSFFWWFGSSSGSQSDSNFKVIFFDQYTITLNVQFSFRPM